LELLFQPESLNLAECPISPESAQPEPSLSRLDFSRLIASRWRIWWLRGSIHCQWWTCTEHKYLARLEAQTATLAVALCLLARGGSIVDCLAQMEIGRHLPKQLMDSIVNISPQGWPDCY